MTDAQKIAAMLRELSEAVTQARHQMPDSAYTKGLQDAERIVWKAARAS